MFFNICSWRIANPYSIEGWDYKSQPQALPFQYFMKGISGREGEMDISGKTGNGHLLPSIDIVKRLMKSVCRECLQSFKR